MGIRIGIGFGRIPFESIETFRAWLGNCKDGGIDSSDVARQTQLLDREVISSLTP